MVEYKRKRRSKLPGGKTDGLKHEEQRDCMFNAYRRKRTFVVERCEKDDKKALLPAWAKTRK